MTDERDDRQADLRAEVQRLRQDIDECWAPLYHSTKAERDIAEAKVARVEALAEEWLTEFGPASELENVMGQQSVTIKTAVRLIRAALDGDA